MHTHKNKKLLSIPLKLVPSLAKLPSLVTPFPLGRRASHTQYQSFQFLAPSEKHLCVASPYFRALPIVYGTKVTGVYESLMESYCNNFMTYSEIKLNLYTFF